MVIKSGKNSWDILQDLWNLGIVEMHKKNFDEAAPLLERALAAFQADDPEANGSFILEVVKPLSMKTQEKRCFVACASMEISLNPMESV